jgi:HKD family nuclease
MHNIEMVFQDARNGQPSRVLNAILSIATAARFGSLRVAVAYATARGCSELIGALASRISAWPRIRKEWLVGIDHGVTDPEALRALMSQRNSTVRIPNGDYLIRHRLSPVQRFHPKTYLFEGLDSQHICPFGVFLGSANLTFSGLHFGTEHGSCAVAVPPFSESEEALVRALRSSLVWWDSAWNGADALNDRVLRRYQSARPADTRTEDEDELIQQFSGGSGRVIETHEGVGWATARCFWIQTYELYKNRGRNRPGNQVDCRRGTRVYFGFSSADVPRNTVLGTVLMRYEERPSVERSVRYGNNQMDKVNLPIPEDDGPAGYDHCFLHWERIRGNQFRLTVDRAKAHERWRERSRAQGMYYTFNGTREFGFYS